MVYRTIGEETEMRLLIPVYRSFGGRRYESKATRASKAEAGKVARDFRESGYLARVLRYGGEGRRGGSGYVVYVSTRKK